MEKAMIVTDRGMYNLGYVEKSKMLLEEEEIKLI